MAQRRRIKAARPKRAVKKQLVTECLLRYLEEQIRFQAFFQRVERWAKDSDRLSEARKQLAPLLAESKGGRAAVEVATKRASSAQATLQSFEQLILQVRVTRVFDNFLSYITELLTLIFISKPETLKSGEQIRVDEVLQHSTMEDLIRNIAERRVDSLSYNSMRELNKYLTLRLSLPLFGEEEQLKIATRIGETRNLIVHNRGILNRRVTEVPGEVGDPIALQQDGVNSDTRFLERAAFVIDKTAIDKFGVPAVNVTNQAGSQVRPNRPPSDED